ncbi:MAG: alcohol dehydrogenase catalytic domain-containing protein [Eubacteriales bacterium]
MINYIYQLVSPRSIMVSYNEIDTKNKVVIRPEYMSICHADQRYYLGERDVSILSKKLPMALIHEACGRVVMDLTNTFSVGQHVVMVPNVPGSNKPMIYENYNSGSFFLSSGYDGFMREVVDLPVDRVIPYEGIKPYIAATTEFMSVAVHAVNRLKAVSHCNREHIAIWGSGSLAYAVSCILKALMPESKITVIGRERNKLEMFSFVERTYLTENIPDSFTCDHAFECAGGEGSYFAIEDIIRYINPQGTAILMGVSENKVAINTRRVLEKGIMMLGCSRSGYEDFKKAIEIMKDKKVQNLLELIIYEDEPVFTIEDITRVFATDANTPFKTVFAWKM